MEFLNTLWLSIMGIFSTGTPVMEVVEVEPALEKKEEVKEVKTIETVELGSKQEDEKESEREVAHKRESNIAFVKSRKELENPKPKRVAPVKIEMKRREETTGMVAEISAFRKKEAPLITKIEMETKQKLLPTDIRRLQKQKEEEDKIESLTAEAVANAPNKIVILEDLGIELTYPQVDFTQIDYSSIYENSDEYIKKFVNKSNFITYKCEEKGRLNGYSCEKGVRIDCYIGVELKSIIESPMGIDINTTSLSLEEYIASQIKPIFNPSKDEASRNLKILQIDLQSRVVIDDTFAYKFHLTGPYKNIYNTFIYGKTYNYILKTYPYYSYNGDYYTMGTKTYPKEAACVQEIIDSIKFLDK